MPLAWVTANDLDDATSPDAESVAAVASLVVYALSGRRWAGILERTEVYRCANVECSPRLQSAQPDGLWLRRRPVRKIVQVQAGWGEDSPIVSEDQYEVRDRSRLAPTYQSEWNPCPATRVTYLSGAEPPQAGRDAARVLANEMLKARGGFDECRLPERVTNVSRQGLSYTILDPQDFLDNGRTGLYEVDLFLKSVNPDRARSRPRVVVPDGPRPYRVT